MANKNISRKSFEKKKEIKIKEIVTPRNIKKLKAIKNQDFEDEQSEDSKEQELEDIVSRTPSQSISSQRHNINPSLEISEESQTEPRLEEQIQDTPTQTSQTKTETDNVQRYVSNAPSYSSASYEAARGDYDGAGYPKMITPEINPSSNPFLTQTPFDTFQRQQIVKPWMDQMQTQGPSAMGVEEKKYEPIGEPKKKKIW